MFALQLTFDIEDIETVAATALTDDSNDKACDLLYVDRNSGNVVLAQGYEAKDVTKLQAPGSKAATLHQAINWLFSKEQPKGVPDTLLSAWRELHDALEDGVIESVELWYVHNLPECKQIAQELHAARDAAHARLAHEYSADINVSAIEIGRNVLSHRYESSQTPILVSDDFTVSVPGSFLESGEKWTALCTSVPAKWLHEQYARYGAELFSANVRGYLGSRQSQSNINNGIQETVRTEPTSLWSYNNGITALVHGFEQEESSVTITGLAIVNGAQTTGAIGSVPCSDRVHRQYRDQPASSFRNHGDGPRTSHDRCLYAA